jgi:flagellar biosynthetic protein FliS
MERSRAITKASQVLIQLITALDHKRGGELSLRLAALYDYMLRRLGEANFRQRDEPLAEVLSLLATLAEGWEGVRSTPKPEPAAANPWSPGVAPESAGAYAEHAWSF